MSSQGFSYDSIFIRMLNRVGDVVLLSVLFTLFCLPVITIGPSMSALYYTAMKGIQGDDGYIWKNFIKSFKENFKQATALWLCFIVAFVILGVDVWFWAMQIKLGTNVVVKCLAVVSIIMLLVAIFVFTYSFPLLAKFDNRNSITIRNAFFLSIKNFPITVIILVIDAVVVWTFYYQPALAICGYALIGFGIIGYLYAFFMLKCFKPYLQTEAGEHGDDMDWRVDVEEQEDDDQNEDVDEEEQGEIETNEEDKDESDEEDESKEEINE